MTQDTTPSSNERDPYGLVGRLVKHTNKSLSFFLLISLVINVGLVGVVTILSLRKPLPGETYAMDAAGNRQRLMAFTSSGNSLVRLNNFTSATASQLLTFNFLNRNDAIASYANHFTSGGYEQYKEAIKSSRIADYMDNNQEAWSSVAYSVPVVAGSDVYANGSVKRWLMEVVIQTRRVPKSKAAVVERRKVTLEIIRAEGEDYKINTIGWTKDEG